MSTILAVPLDRPGVSPREISARLRSQLIYFGSAAGTSGVPPLGDDEYWFARLDVENWLRDGVFYLVSPLDTANKTEVELSEEQEDFLTWLHDQGVQHVRISG
jgi:hypothetical protein